MAAIIAAVGVPLALGMMARAPSWWRTIDPRSQSTVRAGTELENQIVEIVSRVRPAARSTTTAPYQSEPWTIAIRAADANAWVNARLPKWVTNRGIESGAQPSSAQPREGAASKSSPRTFVWPDEIEQVQVEFARGMIHIGARVSEVTEQAAGSPGKPAVRVRGKPRIVSASLVPELAADGSLWMRAEGISLGSLPLPTSLLLSSAARAESLPRQLRELPETARLLQALAGEVPLTASPTLSPGDGRRVRVLSIRPEDGLLILTCRTERK